MAIYPTPPDLFVEDKQIWETPTCEGRLIYPEGCVSLLNKSNPIQSLPRTVWQRCRNQWFPSVALLPGTDGAFLHQILESVYWSRATRLTAGIWLSVLPRFSFARHCDWRFPTDRQTFNEIVRYFDNWQRMASNEIFPLFIMHHLQIKWDTQPFDRDLLLQQKINGINFRFY